MEQFLRDRLFAPIGMPSARPVFDAAGTFIGSSYVHATAREFSRFGQLYLDDGIVGGRRILPEGWVDHARVQVAVDPESSFCDGEDDPLIVGCQRSDLRGFGLASGEIFRLLTN